MKSCRFTVFGVVAGLTLLLVALGGADPPAPAHPGPEFYYFNPDSSQNNLARIKLEMDNFFALAGYPIVFQPFAHEVDFDQKLKEKRPAFIFLPQWYVHKREKDLHLRRLLVPVQKGETTYRKVLLVSKHSDLDLKDLKIRSIASTSMGPDGDKMLKSIILTALGVDAGTFNTVVVPKDTDAVFALTLGQVSMALVSKENMEQIARINPVIAQSVRSLGESAPIPMPVLCYSEGTVTPAEVERLRALFLDADKQEMRTRIMEMLQIDEWRSFSQ